MNFLLPILYALLNRVRGADIEFRFIKFDFIAKLLMGFTFGFLVSENYLVIFLCIILFFIGESFGWGKWIGTLIDGKPRYDTQEGRSEFIIFGRKIVIWDGIHHLANLIINERKNHVGYAIIALFIRGIYWFGPLFIIAYLTNSCDIDKMLIRLGLISMWFPLSILIAEHIKMPNIKGFIISNEHNGKHQWEKAEIVYGFIQGFLIMGLIS